VSKNGIYISVILRHVFYDFHSKKLILPNHVKPIFFGKKIGKFHILNGLKENRKIGFCDGFGMILKYHFEPT